MKMIRVTLKVLGVAVFMVAFCFIGVEWMQFRRNCAVRDGCVAFWLPNQDANTVRVEVRGKSGSALAGIPVLIVTSSGASEKRTNADGKVNVVLTDDRLMGLRVGEFTILNRRNPLNSVLLSNGLDFMVQLGE